MIDLKIIEKAEEYEEDIIRWRRDLHRIPEPSFKEFETVKYIRSEMEKLSNVEILSPTETSLLVILKGEKPGKKIGLRADIDALVIEEDRPDLDFTSENKGCMHACGHDAHAAMLMGAAKYLSENKAEVCGEIYFIFQHAEELPPGGAIEMVETGLFNDLDFIFGQHVSSTLPLGTVDIKTGPVSANSDTYEINIIGKGGHASTPNTSKDPIIIGGIVLTEIQTIISRVLNPINGRVITNSVFQSGNRNALNVIPETAFLAGSVRTFFDEDRFIIRDTIEKIVKSTCDIYGADYEYNYSLGYSSTINDEKTTEIVRDILSNYSDIEIVSLPAAMGGEDFSAFSRIIPGTYIQYGTASEGFDYPHHNPKFGVDEKGLITGFIMNVLVALNYSKLAEQ